MHRLQDLVRLHRMGNDARTVARLLKMGPNTERAYRSALTQAGLLYGSIEELPDPGLLRAAVEKYRAPKAAPQEESSIEKWSERVAALLDDDLRAKAIHDRLRLEDPSFKGSYWAVKRMVQRLQRGMPVSAGEIAIRVETGPGEVAQVDFGEVERLFDPERQTLRRAWVFIMVLGYSRHMFAKVVFDQKTATWLNLHVEAFDAFGGVPKIVVPDNLKAAVIRAAFGIHEEPSLNRSYREFARHFGFKIDPTPAYEPKKKGKVESSVKYVKRNGLAGRGGEPIDEVNVSLAEWVDKIAGTRRHGTTGQQPKAMFLRSEQTALLPVPSIRYEVIVWKKVKVPADVHVAFEEALYSVPWQLKDKEVWVKATSSSVLIIDGEDQRRATHPRGPAGSRNTIEEHLPEGRRDLRHRSREHWEGRAMAIGPEVLAFVKDVFDADEVLYQLRTVQAIVTYLEKFPPTRARSASERARFFGNHTYKGIKRILEQGLDLEPLPTAMFAPSEPSLGFRFARSITELIQAKVEDRHEPN